MPGPNAYPYRYDRTTTIASIKERFDSLEPGSETSEHVAIAGRIATIRSHGKVAFADLKDATGTIQLFAQYAVLGDDGMSAFLDLPAAKPLILSRFSWC